MVQTRSQTNALRKEISCNYIDYVRIYATTLDCYMQQVDAIYPKGTQYQVDELTQYFKNVYKFTKHFITPKNMHIKNVKGEALSHSFGALHAVTCIKPAEFTDNVQPGINITELLVAVKKLAALYATLNDKCK